MSCSTIALFLSVGWLAISSGGAFSAPQPRKHAAAATSRSMPLHMSSVAMTSSTSSGWLSSVLKKPSKTLSVSLEFVPTEDDTLLNPVDLSTLSMQLRKCKASTIWTSSIKAATEFVKEQQSAKGDFPGPCPVIYNGENVDEAVQAAQVDGVVLSPRQMDKALTLDGIETVWHVSSVEDVTSIVDSSFDNIFLVESKEILESIPPRSVVVGILDSMQDENAELTLAKELKEAGCSSILLQRACVGDAEDIEYAMFAVDGLTRKKSTEFNLTGLTGSTNGHFGGVASTGPRTWRRKQTQ